jgi:hypothetical protein
VQDRDTRAALLDLVAQFLALAERIESEAAEEPKKTRQAGTPSNDSSSAGYRNLGDNFCAPVTCVIGRHPLYEVGKSLRTRATGGGCAERLKA